jgi:hypothetical protein
MDKELEDLKYDVAIEVGIVFKHAKLGADYTVNCTNTIVSLAEEYAEALITSEKNKLLNDLEDELDNSYRKSGQGSRTQFSKDTETRGEHYARTQGFKSGILTAKKHVDSIKRRIV